MSASLHPRKIADRIDEVAVLDRITTPVAGAVRTLVPSGPVKDFLSGTWLGHPLHPLLTDIPIGAWTSAAVLDVMGGRRGRRGADVLVGLGLAAALPTAAAGLADWSDIGKREQRSGLVHATANAAASLLYAASLGARLRGRRARGVLLGFLGIGAMTVGGYLGGHLSYRRGVGVDRNAFDEGPRDWTVVIDAAEVREGKPVLARAEGIDLLLYREADTVQVLADRCSHQGGPLHRGTIDDGCVTCPWHGSVFRLASGEVVHGPATGDQPAYDTRVVGGKIEVQLRPGSG